jgi:hypothetical protein
MAYREEYVTVCRIMPSVFVPLAKTCSSAPLCARIAELDSVRCLFVCPQLASAAARALTAVQRARAQTTEINHIETRRRRDKCPNNALVNAP